MRHDNGTGQWVSWSNSGSWLEAFSKKGTLSSVDYYIQPVRVSTMVRRSGVVSVRRHSLSTPPSVMFQERAVSCWRRRAIFPHDSPASIHCRCELLFYGSTIRALAELSSHAIWFRLVSVSHGLPHGKAIDPPDQECVPPNVLPLSTRDSPEPGIQRAADSTSSTERLMCVVVLLFVQPHSPQQQQQQQPRLRPKTSPFAPTAPEIDTACGCRGERW